MPLSVSSRTSEIIQSEIRNMSIECDRVDGINLSQCICDLELPRPVRIGAQEAMLKGINHYTRYDGLPELRQAIAEKPASYNNVLANPEENIIISGGSTRAFYCAGLALLNPGDEVIVFEPYYGYHITTLIAANAVPVFDSLEPPDWSFSIETLEKIITPRTKGIMVNTPANPCGKVFSREELEQIANIAVKHQLFVFTDEIYEYFIYDGYHHISPASIPSIAEQTIIISGYSKTFSITGWRIGYAFCNKKWAQMIGYINDLIYVCAPAPLQIGVAQGINELPKEFYKTLRDQYRVKRNRLCKALMDSDLKPFIPQGAYYVLADVGRLPSTTSKDKAMYLLQKTGVATVPGDAFYSGHQGQNLVRFCFAKDDNVIEEACQRLKQIC